MLLTLTMLSAVKSVARRPSPAVGCRLPPSIPDSRFPTLPA